MLNFREELSKIKEEKFKAKGIYEKAVETILEKLLQYFNSQDVFTILDSRKFYWRARGREVQLKEMDSNDRIIDEVLFRHICNSQEEASLVLIYLEQKFADEGYEIITPKSSVRCGYFNVIIKP